jgi:hypothetical protein
MQTKNYTSDLFPLVEALCGCQFSSNEVERIRAMINSRAKRAYRATQYWPRWLVVAESRAVSSGTIPFSEGSLDDIDEFIQINRTEPFQTASSQVIEFYVTAGGATLIDGNLNLDSAFVTYKKQFQDSYGDGSSGTQINVPEEWFEYIAHGTYADFLRAEGQQEKAALADAEAQDKLADELLKVHDQHSVNTLALQRTHTHANMQPRW